MKLQCVCGKVLGVPDSMAGEKIRCKECGKVMTVRPPSGVVKAQAPAVPAADDPLAVKGHRRCSGCGRSWPMRDKICTACGLNMDTGAALYVSLDESVAPKAKKSAGPGIVSRLLRLIGMKGH